MKNTIIKIESLKVHRNDGTPNLPSSGPSRTQKALSTPAGRKGPFALLYHSPRAL